MNEEQIKAIIYLLQEMQTGKYESIKELCGNVYMDCEDDEFEGISFENDLCNLVQDVYAELEGDRR